MSTSTKRTKRIKFATLSIALVLAASMFFIRDIPESLGQTLSEPRGRSADGFPNAGVIDRFDQLVQKRFLTQPSFGMRRIAPTEPEPLQSVHVGTRFVPAYPNESEVVSELAGEGWRTGLYLYGKRATPRENKKGPTGKFDIRYRVNRPVSVVTYGSKIIDDELPDSEKIIDEVKEAFLKFQSAPTADPSEMRFSKGKWAFVARPVRAVNQSCVQCHSDYVVTAKLGDGKYEFRKRKVGDVNGVIVYAFARKKD